MLSSRFLCSIVDGVCEKVEASAKIEVVVRTIAAR